MITNLFSVFDPGSSILSLSWVVVITVSLLTATNIWNVSSPIINLLANIMTIFNNEVNFTLNNTESGTQNIIIIAFITILLLNISALYPQVFSPTSHLAVTLPLSLLFWLSIVSFGWSNNTNHILSHLLPQGTPGALIIFIVLIELVSNIIRPITLCVRLTANLIAGHLLITLLGNALSSLSILGSATAIVAPLTLTVLESAVACIQAYVFITLITLYTTEIN